MLATVPGGVEEGVVPYENDSDVGQIRVQFFQESTSSAKRTLFKVQMRCFFYCCI